MERLRIMISPGRYVQGKGALHRVGEYLEQLGSSPLFVADDLVWGFVGHDVESSLRKAGLPLVREKFNGITSDREVDRLVDAIKRAGADIVVAVGGGSTIDAVKAAGFLAGIRWANCPTVASTDAPCSALSVIYTENGEFEEYRFFPRNPDLVLTAAHRRSRVDGGRRDHPLDAVRRHQRRCRQCAGVPRPVLPAGPRSREAAKPSAIRGTVLR
ncbi:iron-containing alcohol dehydrogenase [Saccharopolyspora pogona]|uniref:iron-containing alcohol dehydrogenase n=1 Tax=Saccharopolyspora pogona TaxID=333966 RepID=UPI001689E410|nr:iron-containing alcohol dehydrogenase [Saccharopolyspora pogona]